MKKIIISALVVLLLLSVVTVTIMYKMGEKFLDEMIMADIGNLDNIASDIDNDNKSGESQDNKNDVDTGTYDNSNSSSENDGNAEENNSNNSSNTNSEDKLQTKPIIQSPKPVITKEKAKEIQESITFTDKMTAATLVAKRLSTEDVDLLKGMAAGGLSPEEKEKAKKIAFDRFTPEEIEQIKEIYHKYMK